MLRRNTQLIATSVGVGAWLGYVYLPNTAGLDVYETMFRSKTIFQSDSVKALIKEVVQDVSPIIPKVNVLEHCKFFPTKCHFALSRGSLKSQAILGYPEHMACQTPRQIMNTCVLHVPATRTEVNWNSAPGVLIRESFLLSDECKKFIIARELFKLNSNYMTYKAILGSSLYVCWSLSTLFARKVVLTARVISILIQKLNNLKVLFKGPMETRQTHKQVLNQFMGINLTIQFLIATVCVIIYLNRINKRTRDIEYGANEQAASLGPAYINGGAQWGDSVLMRQMAFVGTHDPAAKKYLTEEGVHKTGLLKLSLIGLSYIPIGQQRAFFREKAVLPQQSVLDDLLEGSDKETH